eukprot:2808072-Pleurochrysis_carterae.AAC.3
MKSYLSGLLQLATPIRDSVSRFTQILIANTRKDQVTFDSQNLRHSAKATYNPLGRWGVWRRDGPTYTSLFI